MSKSCPEENCSLHNLHRKSLLSFCKEEQGIVDLKKRFVGNQQREDCERDFTKGQRNQDGTSERIKCRNSLMSQSGQKECLPEMWKQKMD